MKYILVDTANTFFRGRHIASRHSDDWEKIGMAINVTLTSVQKVVNRFGSSDDTHVVFCLEGRSWRKDFYEPYKRNRAVKYASLTEKEIELDKQFWETYENFTTFIKEKTNVSVLRCPTAEADDLIARFISLHPNDEHYIVSTDSDFVQLIAPNVKLYNGVNDHLFAHDGVTDAKNRKLSFTIESNSKIKVGKPDPNFVMPEDYQKLVLFMKCVRGDSGDNVFSAYPGVRLKGTKKSVGLMETYADRETKGFNWNNMMLQRWVDPDGVEHRVLDDYERNRTLIDLTAQPEEVKDQVDDSIVTGVRVFAQSQVGIHFLKFCAKYELNRIGDQVEIYSRWINNPYRGILHKNLEDTTS